MKPAGATPAVEAKTEGTYQVAASCRFEVAFCLRKKFSGPGFGESSLLKALVRE